MTEPSGGGQWHVDPRTSDTDFLVSTVGAGVGIGPLTVAEAEPLLRDLTPGTWVVLSLCPDHRPLGRTIATLQRAGLTDVEMWWEAPRRSGRSMLVPLRRRSSVIAALHRHERSPRGRLRAAVATLFIHLGLTALVARDVIAVGRVAAR